MTKHHAPKKGHRRRMKETGKTYQQLLREAVTRDGSVPAATSASWRDDVPLPEPLRRAMQSLTSEAVMNCEEVLRYTEPELAHDTQRMTLYRATDAADTMNSVALLMAAFSQRSGMPLKALDSYLQAPYQRDRSLGPTDKHQAQLAAVLGEAAPAEGEGVLARYLRSVHSGSAGMPRADDTELERVWTAASLHGLRAALCDDVDALDDYLPSHIAHLAKQVATVLGSFQPPSV
ncbi:hypothetical protein [Streptomyces sp. NPDC055400]